MSTLVIDTIQGKTTAGSINVRGEGSNNTNLQQGLAKSWCNFQGTSTISIHNSFNQDITLKKKGEIKLVKKLCNFVKIGNKFNVDVIIMFFRLVCLLLLFKGDLNWKLVKLNPSLMIN